jgi:hypothetical protein
LNPFNREPVNELRGSGSVEEVMLPVVRFAVVSGPVTTGEVVLRAGECLRDVGIKPIAFVFSDHPQMTFSPRTHKRAVALLVAAGFEFTVS